MGQLTDFQTGKHLELSQLPQLEGFKLIMVEHTHPVAEMPMFGANGFSAHSNADMYMAAANHGVIFVVNQALRSGPMKNVTRIKFLYYGF